MTSDDQLRAKLTKALAENGVEPDGAEMHGLCCSEPDRYPGYCQCIPELVDDLAAVVRAHLADAYTAGFRANAPHTPDEQIATRNPWEQGD